MIIKKYTAKTEKEAILLAREDLGPDAIVMNVKEIRPGGLSKLFKKSRVELTAAIDDNNEYVPNHETGKASADENTKKESKGSKDSKPSKDNKSTKDGKASKGSKTVDEGEAKEPFGKAFASSKEYSLEGQNAIEERIDTLARLLEQQLEANKKQEMLEYATKKAEEAKMKQSSEQKETTFGKASSQTVSAQANQGNRGNSSSTEASNKRENQSDSKSNGMSEALATEENVNKTTEASDEANGMNKVVALIKKQLQNNEVKSEYADMIIKEMGQSDKTSIDNLLALAYQKIVLKLGEIESIKPAEEKKPKIVFFVGNTGVGKTTTMAKLASKSKLEEKKSVAMFSVDTYRIAAIEQSKTYANILNAPFEVIYTPDDMLKYSEKHKNCDLIFVDTAGRSHRNEEQRKDLMSILNSVPDCEKEIYLVLSITTKYSDLIDITETYGDLFDFNLIFTKLDETKEMGNILNLKLDTNKALSYVTWGQNVPDDIGIMNPQVIAKSLLGGAK